MTVENQSESLQEQIEVTKSIPYESEDLILRQAVVRLNGTILGLVLGIVGAIAIFVATNWLVLKGGDQVGPHLSLLGQYFLGYEVTFVGSLVGAAYGFVTGFLGGLIIGWIYNAIVFIRTPKSHR